MTYLTKLMALPFYPIGLCILLLLLSIVLLYLKKNRLGFIFVILGTFELLFFSFPPVSHFLLRSLEKQYTPSQTYPKAPAIVLLGGCEIPKLAPRIYDETNEFGDRLMHTARLFDHGFSPRIFVTGGKIPQMDSFEGSTADASYRLLIELFGIDSAAIFREPNAQNTHDNAIFVKKMMDSLGLKSEVILVTSAMHMPRSVLLFKKAGFTVYPAPTDYIEQATFLPDFVHFWPDVSALMRSTIAIHEFYGMIAYKVLGWI